MLYRITSPRFCAGLVVVDGSVTRCAPILRRRFMGAVFMQVVVTCVNEGWVLEHVDPREPECDLVHRSGGARGH